MPTYRQAIVLSEDADTEISFYVLAQVLLNHNRVFSLTIFMMKRPRNGTQYERPSETRAENLINTASKNQLTEISIIYEIKPKVGHFFDDRVYR